jgi:hypothetical protein
MIMPMKTAKIVDITDPLAHLSDQTFARLLRYWSDRMETTGERMPDDLMKSMALRYLRLRNAARRSG